MKKKKISHSHKTASWDITHNVTKQQKCVCVFWHWDSAPLHTDSVIFGFAVFDMSPSVLSTLTWIGWSLPRQDTEPHRIRSNQLNIFSSHFRWELCVVVLYKAFKNYCLFQVKNWIGPTQSDTKFYKLIYQVGDIVWFDLIWFVQNVHLGESFKKKQKT